VAATCGVGTSPGDEQDGNVKLRDLARHVIDTGEIPVHQT
jgi:hypothetical protein